MKKVMAVMKMSPTRHNYFVSMEFPHRIPVPIRDFRYFDFDSDYHHCAPLHLYSAEQGVDECEEGSQEEQCAHAC